MKISAVKVKGVWMPSLCDRYGRQWAMQSALTQCRKPRFPTKADAMAEALRALYPESFARFVIHAPFSYQTSQRLQYDEAYGKC